MTQNIVIIDYGMGNLRSVYNALKKVVPNDQVQVTNDPQLIDQADRIIFPGQGAAADCMKAINQQHLNQAILKATQNKPFLGICMGLQVLLKQSEENDHTVLLGLIDGQVKHFSKKMMVDDCRLKIPQMGWNQVQQTAHPLWQEIEDFSRFYFVHSYYVDLKDKNLTVGTTDYGIQYTSALAIENLFAVQFHPEKSADNGLQLLHNFTQWNP